MLFNDSILTRISQTLLFLCIPTGSSFTPLLFKSLGAGSAAFGFALFLNCSAEVPCFVISSRIPNPYFARLMALGLAAGAGQDGRGLDLGEHPLGLRRGHRGHRLPAARGTLRTG